MHLLLFDTVKIVEGAKNGLLIDTQKFKYFIINKPYLNALRILKTHSIGELYCQCPVNEQIVIKEFINDVCNKELGFLTSSPDKFSGCDSLIGQSEFFYGPVDNAIIEIFGTLGAVLRDRIFELVDIGCRAVELRFIGYVDYCELENVFQLFARSTVSAINLCLPFQTWMKDFNILNQFCRMNLRIHLMVIHNSPFNKSFETNTHVIHYIQDKINELSCGSITKDSFSCNTFFFFESTISNSCLHKKLSIDRHGNIKNCPSMPESYGNIKDTTLAEAIEKPGFKKYWDMNKDKIHVCKDCEFRYICTDCRAYVEDPEDILSKPLKCGYNPYTGEWSEWSTNPLKQKAIDFYGMREMVEGMNTID
jgi:SPASM domain peptide maturase of grasp-with-spasm system